jgi:sugar phosphate isomerase/epimerase
VGTTCASYHTLSGGRHGEPPVYPLLARAVAAAWAGIPAIGAHADDLIGDGDPWVLQREMSKHLVTVPVLEWVSLDQPRDKEQERRLFKMADIFHSRQLNVGVCSTEDISDRTLVNRLGKLAFRAQQHELTVAVEPVCFGSLDQISRVQELIDNVNEPNVGTLLDVYHLARADWGTDVSDINPDMVAGIQVCGVSKLPPAIVPAAGYKALLLEDCQDNRLFPDEGDFPVDEWLANLKAAGVETDWVEVEVISQQVRDMNIYDAAWRVAKSMKILQP